MNNNLTSTNQNAKLLLEKTKNLLNIANNLLSEKETNNFIEKFKFKPFLLEKGHQNPVSSVKISPDGKYIISKSDDIVKIWDFISGECLITLGDYQNDRINSVSISLYEKLVASVQDDKIENEYDLQKAKCLNNIGKTNFIEVSPDGKYILSNSDHIIKKWNFESKKYLRALEGHKDCVLSVAISSNGETIVSGSKDNTIKIWNSRSGECIKTLKGHTGAVFDISISLDERIIISKSKDHTVKIWDFITGECINTLKGHTRDVRSLVISHDEKYIASGSDDHTIKIWDYKTGKCINTLGEYNKDYIKTVLISPDKKTLVIEQNTGYITIWDIKSAEFLNDFYEDSGYINWIEISPDGKNIITEGCDYIIRIWDIKSCECLETLEKNEYYNLETLEKNEYYDEEINPTIVSQYDKYTVTIKDIKSGKCILTVDTNYCIAINSNGYFNGSEDLIDKYIRISESPFTQRKLTKEEREHFRIKGNSLEVDEVIKIQKIDMYDEIPF